MDNNNMSPIDIDSIMEEIEDRIEDMVEEQVEDAIEDEIQNHLQEMIGEALSDMEITLANGTVIRPPKRMLLLNPDKTKMLLCYGGLRVDGCTLMVHTRISCWESIYVYPTREEAIDALVKVKNAMISGAEIFEL